MLHFRHNCPELQPDQRAFENSTRVCDLCVCYVCHRMLSKCTTFGHVYAAPPEAHRWRPLETTGARLAIDTNPSTLLYSAALDLRAIEQSQAVVRGELPVRRLAAYLRDAGDASPTVLRIFSRHLPDFISVEHRVLLSSILGERSNRLDMEAVLAMHPEPYTPPCNAVFPVATRDSVRLYGPALGGSAFGVHRRTIEQLVATLPVKSAYKPPRLPMLPTVPAWCRSVAAAMLRADSIPVAERLWPQARRAESGDTVHINAALRAVHVGVLPPDPRLCGGVLVAPKGFGKKACVLALCATDDPNNGHTLVVVDTLEDVESWVRLGGGANVRRDDPGAGGPAAVVVIPVHHVVSAPRPCGLPWRRVVFCCAETIFTGGRLCRSGVLLRRLPCWGSKGAVARGDDPQLWRTAGFLNLLFSADAVEGSVAHHVLTNPILSTQQREVLSRALVVCPDPSTLPKTTVAVHRQCIRLRHALFASEANLFLEQAHELHQWNWRCCGPARMLRAVLAACNGVEDAEMAVPPELASKAAMVAAEAPTVDECSVCYRSLRQAVFPTRLPCLHVFCKDCVNSVHARDPRCPLCRTDFVLAAVQPEPPRSPAPVAAGADVPPLRRLAKSHKKIRGLCTRVLEAVEVGKAVAVVTSHAAVAQELRVLLRQVLVEGPATLTERSAVVIYRQSWEQDLTPMPNVDVVVYYDSGARHAVDDTERACAVWGKKRCVDEVLLVLEGTPDDPAHNVCSAH